MSKFSAYLEKFKKYHFEIKHLIVLFIVLIFFMILVSLVQKTSLQELLLRTQEWYQRDSAERMANLTATSLELLLENAGSPFSNNPEERQRMVQSFNIILSQQILQQNVEAVCIFVSRGGQIYAIDDGNVL
ncbi:MAG: histidine kinase, partial [Calditrichaeota bacterium]|nr:histidine kinase [Calditrichota bacterium]